VVFAADDDRISHGHLCMAQNRKALRGLLKQTVMACQTQKLLRETSA
jgi:hypothetical protein